jgi:type III pantothenate kinase
MAKRVEFPEKTGIDRLLSAWEAWNFINGSVLSSEQSAVLVVQAGTALTVDCVAEDGTYLGGAIAPGLGLSLQLLAAGTDQLPWLGNHQVTAEPRLPGKNTAWPVGLVSSSSVIVPKRLGGRRRLLLREEMQSSWFLTCQHPAIKETIWCSEDCTVWRWVEDLQSSL